MDGDGVAAVAAVAGTPAERVVPLAGCASHRLTLQQQRRVVRLLGLACKKMPNSAIAAPAATVKGRGNVGHVEGLTADNWLPKTGPFTVISRCEIEPRDGAMDVSGEDVSAGAPVRDGGRNEHQ